MTSGDKIYATPLPQHQTCRSPRHCEFQHGAVLSRRRRSEKTFHDGALVSQSPVWLATAYDDELPIVVLRPRKCRATSADGTTEYIDSIIDSAGQSRLLLDEPDAAVRLFDIDCDALSQSVRTFAGARTSLLGAAGCRRSREKDLLRTPTAGRPVQTPASIE